MVLNTVALWARQQLEKLQTATVGQSQLFLAGCFCGRPSMWLTRTASASAKQFQLQFVIISPQLRLVKCLTKSCIPQKTVSCPHTDDRLFTFCFSSCFFPIHLHSSPWGDNYPLLELPWSIPAWGTADDWIPAVCDEVWWSTLQNAP